jgi:DNA polymerase III epsilon subunit-like protein
MANVNLDHRVTIRRTMREIVIDTETTGLEPLSGHRVVEIGAVELVDCSPTGRTFHRYVCPQRAVPADAATGKPPIATERVIDTLVLARRKHAGGLALDDLCVRSLFRFVGRPECGSCAHCHGEGAEVFLRSTHWPAAHRE